MRQWLVAAVLTLSSCATANKPPAAAVEPPVTSSPEVPDPALADGKVTLAEYQAGFARWVQCSKDGGVIVEAEKTDPMSGLISFRIYGNGDGSDNPRESPTNPAGKCYRSTFAAIDQWFGANDPLVQAHLAEEDRAFFREQMVPCLQKNGESASLDAKPGDAEWARVFERHVELTNAGKC
jgi:hypothetical protein